MLFATWLQLDNSEREHQNSHFNSEIYLYFTTFFISCEIIFICIQEQSELKRENKYCLQQLWLYYVIAPSYIPSLMTFFTETVKKFLKIFKNIKQQVENRTIGLTNCLLRNVSEIELLGKENIKGVIVTFLIAMTKHNQLKEGRVSLACNMRLQFIRVGAQSPKQLLTLCLCWVRKPRVDRK